MKRLDEIEARARSADDPINFAHLMVLDVPAMVAALRAALGLCDDYERVADVVGGRLAESEAHVAMQIRRAATDALEGRKS